MNRAHVNVDRVEQEGGAVWIGIQPAFESDLLEVFGLAGAWLDLRLVQILDVGLLPVMCFGADGGNVETKRRFKVRRVVEAANESVDSDIDCAFDVAVAA